jgi:uncharacterized protein involved in type VI secretion and phage assembly
MFSVLTEHDDVSAFFVVEHGVNEGARFVGRLARDAGIATLFFDSRQDGDRLLFLDLLELRQQSGVWLGANGTRQIGNPRALQETDVRNMQRPQPRTEFLYEPNRVLARDIRGG